MYRCTLFFCGSVMEQGLYQWRYHMVGVESPEIFLKLFHAKI